LDPRVRASLEPVVARWAGQDTDLLRPLFQLAASGQKVDEAVRAALTTSLAELDSSGCVVDIFGITREPRAHRIQVGAATIYCCCALVAHMVPNFLQQSVVIESTDPTSGNKIRLAISAASELQRVEPKTACGVLVDCAADEVLINPRDGFCRHVKHFATNGSATEFVHENPKQFVMTIEEFHHAAQWLYQRVWANQETEYGNDRSQA
jgi:alkylmercury lyase-like protein